MYINCLQVSSHLVSVEMSDHNAPSPVHHMCDLAGVDHHNHTLGAILRHGRHIQGRTHPRTMPGSVARLPGREPVLPAGQLGPVLRGANDSDIAMLRDDMDQSVAQDYTDGQQGRADGADSAEEQGEGGQDAGDGGDPVCGVVVPAVRDIRPDQAGRPTHVLGGGFFARGHTDRPVAGCVQQLHQPRPVRVLQQEVPPGLHGGATKPELLGYTPVQ